MSIKNWISENLRIFHKVTEPPISTDRQGIYLVWSESRKGLYVVSDWNSRKTIYKIFDSTDFFTKEVVEEKLNDKLDKSQLDNVMAGIFFTDMTVNSKNELSTQVKNPKDKWGVFVMDEKCYYRYDSSSAAWIKTPYTRQLADVASREEVSRVNLSVIGENAKNNDKMVPNVSMDADRITVYKRLSVLNQFGKWYEFTTDDEYVIETESTDAYCFAVLNLAEANEYSSASRTNKLEDFVSIINHVDSVSLSQKEKVILCGWQHGRLMKGFGLLWSGYAEDRDEVFIVPYNADGHAAVTLNVYPEANVSPGGQTEKEVSAEFGSFWLYMDKRLVYVDINGHYGISNDYDRGSLEKRFCIWMLDLDFVRRNVMSDGTLSVRNESEFKQLISMKQAECNSDDNWGVWYGSTNGKAVLFTTFDGAIVPGNGLLSELLYNRKISLATVSNLNDVPEWEGSISDLLKVNEAGRNNLRYNSCRVSAQAEDYPEGLAETDPHSYVLTHRNRDAGVQILVSEASGYMFTRRKTGDVLSEWSAASTGVNFATFEIDTETGLLTMRTSPVYNGPEFMLENGNLIVAI